MVKISPEILLEPSVHKVFPLGLLVVDRKQAERGVSPSTCLPRYAPTWHQVRMADMGRTSLDWTSGIFCFQDTGPDQYMEVGKFAIRVNEAILPSKHFLYGELASIRRDKGAP